MNHAGAVPPLPPAPVAMAMTVRGLGRFDGCAHGLNMPSVALELRALQPWPMQREQQLADALSPLPPDPPLDTEGIAPEMRFALLLLRLLHTADWPLPVVLRQFDALRQGEHVRTTLLPCLHGQSVRLLRAAQALSHWLAGDAPLDAMLKLVEDLRAAAPAGKNSVHLLRAALRLGIPVLPLTGKCWQYGWGVHGRLLDSTFSSRTPVIGASLARRKAQGAAVLRRIGLPVPAHHLVHSEAQALAAAARLGWPVVTKPNSSDGGRGVTTGIGSEAELRRGWAEARRFGAEVLVEQHVAGEDYRLTVFHGRVVWVTWRRPGGVTGDGRHDVVTLLAQLNDDPRRRGASQSALKPIALDAEAKALLAEQGLHAHSVPAAGCFVRLRRAANVARGGVSVAANEGVHPDNLTLAVQAAAAFELDIAGIDLLIPDIRRSWREGGAAICEVNAQPQFGTSTQQHLHAQLLRELVPGEGRIPVLLMAGAGAPRRSAELHTRLGVAAAHVGVADRHGAWLGGVEQGRCSTLVQAIEALLFNRCVQALVIVTEDAALAASGLPVDRLDLLWFCSAMADPVGLLRLAHVLAGRHRLVADAADAACRALAAVPGLGVELLPVEQAFGLAIDTLRRPASDMPHAASLPA